MNSERSLLACLILLGLFLLASPSPAHKQPCGHDGRAGNSKHRHPNKSAITCEPENAACTTPDGSAGICRSVQTRVAVLCECQPTGGGGGCLSLGTYYFSDQGDGPPAPNTPIIYLPQTSPDNFVDFKRGEVDDPSFGAEDDVLGGSIELFFGSFFDPENVPVRIDDISIALPSIMGSGPTLVTLHQPTDLVYDSVIGQIDTVDPNGVMVDIANGFGRATVPVYVGADVVSGGVLLYFHLFNPSLLLLDGFESGDFNAWSSTSN